MEQEAQFFKNRLLDLSRHAEDRGIVTFTNFLNLNELNILRQISGELYSSYEISGGYDDAERQMAAFVPDALYYVWEYPMAAVQIAPSNAKFAEQLSHRDVLGALLNLGIRREMLGDILMMEHETVVICADSVSRFLAEQCVRIRHTSVACKIIPIADFDYTPTFIQKEGIVATMRIDSVIADICKLPRKAAQKIILEGSAFVNSQKIQKNDYICQNNDVLSVRHFGKYQILDTENTTRKGKVKYKYNIYA